MCGHWDFEIQQCRDFFRFFFFFVPFFNFLNINIFSRKNQFWDLSLNPRQCDLIGFTETEVFDNFLDVIKIYCEESYIHPARVKRSEGRINSFEHHF